MYWTCFLDARDYKFPVNATDVEAFKEFCAYPTAHGCLDDVADVYTSFMRERQLNIPNTFKEAVELFSAIKQRWIKIKKNSDMNIILKHAIILAGPDTDMVYRGELYVCLNLI